MSVKIAYNNTPSLVLLCGNMVKLDPAGMPNDHAELSEEQQQDAAVKNLEGRGSIALLSMDEAAKREGRRPKAAPPSKPPRTSVENPATPPPAPEATKEEPAPEPEKAPEPKPAEKTETDPEPEADQADEKNKDADDAKSKGKKGKKSRHG